MGSFLKNRYSIVALISTISLVLVFQNCSRTKFSGGEEESASNSTEAFVAEENQIQKVSIQHITGHQEFTISTIGVKVSDSTCKVQFEKNNTTWVDLSAEFDCSQNIDSAIFLLPNTNNWTNNFNATGVRIRLIKTSDSSPVAYFSQNLTCVSKSPSNSATPNIDENCNAQWDDFTPGAAKTCSVDSGSIMYGSSYNCAASITCPTSGKLGTFKEHFSKHSTYFYTTSACDYRLIHSTYLYEPSSISTTLSGIIGSYPDSGCFEAVPGSWIAIMPNAWMSSKCVYNYNEDSTYY